MIVPFPISPQLARLQDALPRGEGWYYEPKWDGFRGVLFKDGRKARLQSRNGKDLSSSFPEIATGASHLPDCVLDGELVVVSNGRLEFEGLLERLDGNGSMPAAFIAFDLLALGEKDLRSLPFSDRRRQLEDLGANSIFQVTPQTSDAELASAWLKESFVFGFEGVVAKKGALPYRSGERCLIKVKHLESCDVVVGGYTGTLEAPRGLVVGLYDSDGIFHHVGTTSVLPASERSRFKELSAAENSFEGLQPGPTRWQSNRLADWEPVEPEIACQIAFSRLDGMKFRHSVRFLRWRPDLNPKDCTYEQLERFRSPLWAPTI